MGVVHIKSGMKLMIEGFSDFFLFYHFFLCVKKGKIKNLSLGANNFN